MPEFPTLSQMGINRPFEIVRYTVINGARQDTLKIYYKREAFSLLPSYRSYEFPRRETFNPDTGRIAVGSGEISPTLLSAIDELDKLLTSKEKHTVDRAQLISEMEEFEKYVTDRLATFRAEIKNLD